VASKTWVRDSLLICLGIKCLLIFLGVVAAEVRQDRPIRGIQLSLGLWHRWDALHYFQIAEHGYAPPGDSTTLGRPPLLSALIRMAGWLTGSMPIGGLIVATLISFLPPLLLFRLARCDLDHEDAFRSVLVLLLFPTSFFLHIVYSEGLFLALVMGAFLAARQGRWKTVAVLGCLAGLTRLNAFLLAPALLAEAWGVAARGRVFRVAAALSVSVGIAIFLAINVAVASDPFAFLRVQEQTFFRIFAWPWQGAAKAWELGLAGGTDAMMNGVLQVLFIPLLASSSVFSVVRQRASYAIWTVGNILLFTAQDFWLSVPRLALVLFPAFLWLGPRTRNRVFGTLWFAGSTLLLSFLAGQFAQGWWVS